MANKTKNSPSQGDDRNLVGSDATDLESVEHQLAIFWEKNQKTIIYAVIAVFIVFLGYNAIQRIAVAAEESKIAGYANAEDSEAKRAWADDNSGHPLGGIAYKELADEAYGEGSYDEAEALYLNAVAASKSSLRDAALVGAAMSQLQQGKTSDAQQIFEGLANDPNSGSQAEAQFRLIGLAVESENYDEARSLIEELKSGASEATAYWGQKALQIESSLPAPKEEPAEFEPIAQ